MRTVDAPPKASILIESLRDIGYSLATALADVIDNSITAGARNIRIYVDDSGADSSIGIVDDGRGMPPDELQRAMRLGSQSPKQKRLSHDLGRFGFGLKTASFSQCRRLTVASRHGQSTSVAIWDLDHVAREDSWSLMMTEDVTGIPHVQHLGEEGSIVVWQLLDRAIDHNVSDTGRKHFAREMNDVIGHLELVFHRYLKGEPGLRKVAMSVNDTPLNAFDPFNADHPATIRGQTERVMVGGHGVEITPFTLPHHRNVTASQWDHYAGSAGYLRNQGFYLYREKRLIVFGSWFGLARQMELTKLARVRIDIPNALDAEWQVDIKKASARPPSHVRERLQKIISELGAPSKRIFTMRGVTLQDSRLPLWQRVQEDNAITYRVNSDNPTVKGFTNDLPDYLKDGFRKLLDGISSGIPMDAIFADLAGTPEAVKSAAITDDTLRSLFNQTWQALVESGIQSAIIPGMLRVVEPFRSNWDRVERMLPESDNQ
jgi:hypothetical protein